MNKAIEKIQKYQNINLDYSKIEDFSQALLFLTQNFSILKEPRIFLSTQAEDGVLLSSLLDLPFDGLEFVRNIEPKNCSLLLRTSGSSGIPKLIEKPLAQMHAEAAFLASFIQNDLNLPSIKHILTSVYPQHMFGLTYGVFLPWFLDSKPKVQSVEPFVEHVMAFAEDVLITSPTLLKSIAQAKNISSNFENLKLIISAGSPLGEETRKALQTKAIILDVYGSSETGSIGYNLGDGLRRFNRVKLTCSKDSELIVSSPWCESFQTSDIAEIDGDNIKLLGRSDDIVKINDKRFSLYEITLKVKQNPLITDCIAYPKDNRLAILIQLSLEGLEYFRSWGKQGIVQSIKEQLDMKDKSYLRFFKILSQIPRNPQGKISKEQKQDAIEKKEKIALTEVERGEDSLILEGVVGAGCFYFDGHFVDFPLTPGFVELDLALSYAQGLGISLLDIVKIMNVKFTAFLRPGDYCRLHLEKKDKFLSVKMFANSQVCLSGRILLGAKT